jgi:tetratricopeptide (TPR) repeat protein
VAVAEATGGTQLRLTIALGVSLCALTLAVFLPVLDHAWLNYDDDIYITNNSDLLRGLTRDGVAWAFSTFHGANWFPLTWLSWMLDYEIHGLDPAGFHATGLALHALGALLLFLALSRLTGSAPRSAFVAAVFAVHPLHVESVAWAAARKDPLSGLFWMLALLCYAHSARRQPRAARIALVFVCMGLGLTAKPVVVTLPFALLLLDEWPLGRLRRSDAPGRWDPRRIGRALLEKLPLFALAAAAAAVTVAAQRSGGTVVSLDRVPLDLRVGNALVAYVAYLGKALWPSRLAIFYPHPGDALPGAQIALAAVFLIGATALAAVWARRRPYLFVGWFWYLGTLVPMIGLVQVGSQAMADRYMYLPLVGLSIAVAWGIPELLPDWRWKRVGLALAAVAAVAGLAATAARQLHHWRDSEALFEHALQVTRDNHVAHAYLGSALLERGRTQAAIEHYSEAVRLRPDFLSAANNLAWLLATGENEELRNPYVAVRLAQRAARLTSQGDPSVLDTLAAALAAANRFEEATRVAERGIELARAAGEHELEAAILRRLELYRAGRAYTEEPAGD